MLQPSLALSALVAFLVVAPSSGSGGPDPSHPVAVGSVRFAPAPPAAMDRQVEAAWLRDEARTLGFPAGDRLRARVADALAGPGARGIPGAFNRFHERHRAATRCLAAATDPYADRCIDQPAAPGGSCRWMGEATLCRAEAGAGLWLVLRRGDRARRHRRHAGAVTALRRIYLRAREGRERTAREAKVARALRRAAAERRQRLAQARAARRRSVAARRARLERARADRRARLADPRLSDASLARGRSACARFRRDSELYAFGLGTQDPVGQVNGLLAQRAALGRRLIRAAADRIDRLKLAGFLRVLRHGNRRLRRLRTAREIEHVFAERDAYARGEERAGRLATKLGLPDCAN